MFCNNEINPLTQEAIEVHREMGPGLLESIYEECLAHEFKTAKLRFFRQHPVPIRYKGVELKSELKLDFLVEDKLILELKSVHELIPLFDAQVLSHLKLTNISVGLLMNFNVSVLKNGIKRLICPSGAQTSGKQLGQKEQNREK
jgi:GxxExxY protein